MMHVRMAEVMTGVILAFVTITIGQWAYNKYDGIQPAIEWIEGRAITPVVKKGGILSIEYKAIIRKQCPSDLQHFLIAPDGSSPVRYPTVPGGYRRVELGETTIPVQIEVPKVADKATALYPVGSYVYRAIATRYCENAIQIDNAIPDVAFELVE